MTSTVNLSEQQSILARSAPSAAARHQHESSAQCNQLWAQLQELMQQRERAVSAREQQTAQYGQLELLLKTLAQHVQGLTAQEGAPPIALGLQEQQQQVQQSETLDQHAAAVQVVQQLLQQAVTMFQPHKTQQPHPALPAQRAGNDKHLAPAQLATALSPSRSSTGHGLLGVGNLQGNMAMQQVQQEDGGVAGQQQQQSPSPDQQQQQQQSPWPDQQQQQQQLMRAEFQALSHDMQAQLVHLQQLQATLESELQHARLFAQYMAADPAAAAAFQAWRDNQLHADAAAGALRAPPPLVPQPQGLFNAQHQQPQQEQNVGLDPHAQDSLPEKSPHRSRPSSPAPAAAPGFCTRSDSISPSAITVAQLAAYRLSGGPHPRSRSCTPQPPQQQGLAGAQELATVFPDAASTSPHKRPWPGVDGTGAPEGAAGSSKCQRLDTSQTGHGSQQLLWADGLAATAAAAAAAGGGGDDAGAAVVANSAGVDAATSAQAQAAAAADEIPVPEPFLPPAAAAAAGGPKQHMFRPTVPGRRPLATASASDGSTDAAALAGADAAAAATGDRGAQPAARHPKVFRTQNRYGGGRGGQGGRIQATLGSTGHTAQQQQHGDKHPEPGQQQQAYEGQSVPAQSSQQQQQQQEPEQQPAEQQEPGQQGQPDQDDLEELYQQEQQQPQPQLHLVQHSGSGPVPGWQGVGAGDAGCCPPETLYAAADGQIFYHQQGPEQQGQRGKGRKQQQQQHWQQAAGNKGKKRKKKNKGGVDGEENDADAAEDTAGGRDRAVDGLAASRGQGLHPAAAAAAVGGGGGGQSAPPGRSCSSSYQNGRRHQHQHHQHQQQKQGHPPPYLRQQQLQHQHHQQQQPKGSGPLVRPGMRPRAGGGRRGDEQDASEQELQRMVAELKQQAAAVTAGGSDAAASGS